MNSSVRNLLLLVVVFTLCIAHSIGAQSAPGRLSGIVTSPAGTPVASAPIEITDAADKPIARGTTGADGRYTLLAVPPGTYTVRVTMPCCAIAPFTQTAVKVDAGQNALFDVHLKPGNSQNTLGDDPSVIADAIRKRSRVQGKPVPRLSNRKPSFSGVWLINADPYPRQPSPLPWAAAIAKERTDKNVPAPRVRCLPSTLPTPTGGATPFIVKLVHQQNLLVQLLEEPPGFRQIFLDGCSHPADPNPTWLGHSIGKWDGDTLVIDTIGYNDQSWILGSYPHTEMLRIIERYQRPDFGHLHVQVTYEDPGTFTKPVTRDAVWDLATDDDVLEFVCENNKEGRAAGSQ